MRMEKRCPWCLGSPEYIAYHDREWGGPVHDDRVLFEFLVLEGAQAGLSWSTILAKRENYRRLFARFDPAKVARFTQAKLEKLLADPGIVRNRLKVEGDGEEREGLPRRAEGIRQLRRLRLALRRREAARRPPPDHEGGARLHPRIRRALAGT